MKKAPSPAPSFVYGAIFFASAISCLTFWPLVTDLFVEVAAVLFLDDAAAFLTDLFVELRAVTVAGRLTALTADVLVEA